MSLNERIKELIAEQGQSFKEKSRTLLGVTCPSCGRSDKFSIIKENGACICYRGTCSFGKRWFDEWLSMTARIPKKEAKDLLYNSEFRKVDPTQVFKLNLQDAFSDKTPVGEKLEPIKFPEFHMIKMDSPFATDGQKYLAGRGITMEMAVKYNLYYSPMYRRVIIPITMNGVIYGYQGRHIDPVAEDFRMRNNEGFHRDTLVMFYDNLDGANDAIVAEGPFDAWKFEEVGGNIATMGKVIADKQLELIMESGITALYLALDDDAAKEMNKLVEELSIPVYRIEVPQSCIDRCKMMNPPKKADFGECTFAEAAQAKRDAKKMDRGHFILYLKH